MQVGDKVTDLTDRGAGVVAGVATRFTRKTSKDRRKF